MGASTIADLLQTYGGWGVSGLLAVWLVIVARDNLKVRNQLLSREQDTNKSLMDLMEKRIEADVRHEHAFREMRTMIEKWLDRVGP